MGTDIFDNYGIIITRFFGGTHRGTCFQINIEDKFVQLTKEEFEDFIEKILQKNRSVK